MAHLDINQEKREGVWSLNYGYSNLISGNKEWFMQLDKGLTHFAKLGNESKLKAMVEGQTQTQS